MSQSKKKSNESKEVDFECTERISNSNPIHEIDIIETDKNSLSHWKRLPYLITASDVKVQLVNDEVKKYQNLMKEERLISRKEVDEEIECRRRKNEESKKRKNTSKNQIKRVSKRKQSPANNQVASGRHGGKLFVPLLSSTSPAATTRGRSISASPGVTSPSKKYTSKQSSFTPPTVSPPLYSWIPLQIGKKLGTPAYNKYVTGTAQPDENNVFGLHYTADDIMQMFETMRSKTRLPPERSFMEKSTRSVSNLNELYEKYAYFVLCFLFLI